jgi:citrate lyase beta subunit
MGALPLVVLICLEDSVTQSNGVRADDQNLAFFIEPWLKQPQGMVKVS